MIAFILGLVPPILIGIGVAKIIVNSSSIAGWVLFIGVFFIICFALGVVYSSFKDGW